MLVSIIVRTKDESARLRLALASFSRQTVPLVPPGSTISSGDLAAELIVVNDGSSDKTPAVLEEASSVMPLRVVTHAHAQGRSAAANAGAANAYGDVLLFIDGDTLAGRDCVERHARLHLGSPGMGRGETYHLRCTRFFLDPETGSPQPGQEDHVRRLGADLPRHCVTLRQVHDCFEEIESRAQPGIYPGAGPRQLYDLEMNALLEHPDLSVLWMAASGQNLSMRRSDWQSVGGFDEQLTINEHREIAFKLCEKGRRLTAAVGARTYHLTHRAGWRDPLVEVEWERAFYRAHPCLAVKLMSIFWLSLGNDKTIPEEARITSLPQMESIVRGGSKVDYDSIRRAHPHLAQLDSSD